MENQPFFENGTKLLIKKNTFRTTKMQMEGHLVTIASRTWSESYNEMLYKIRWAPEDNPGKEKLFDLNKFWWDASDFALPEPPYKPLEGGLPLW